MRHPTGDGRHRHRSHPATAPATPGAEPVDATATITFGAPEKESSDRQLSPVDAAASTRCRRAARCSWSSAAPGPAAASCSTRTWSAPVVTRRANLPRRRHGVARHADFRRTATTFRVSDVGSLNGTYVNRDRIDELDLTDGDEVQIGKYRLVFFTGQPQADARTLVRGGLPGPPA